MVNKYKKFILWLVVSNLFGLAGVFAYHLGVVNMLLAGDKTYLTYGIFGLYWVFTFYIGSFFVKHKLKPLNYYILPSFIHYMPDLMVSLGLLGTFIGFGIMLNTNLAIDITSAKEIKEVMTGMSSGLGTALYTSIVGLVCSLAAKIQIYIVEGMRT